MKKRLMVTALLMFLCGCGAEKNPEKEQIDLRVLNDTMAYSQLINIIKQPQDYLGSPILIRGIYTAPFNGFTHAYNYTVTIQDNTQCCAQGIEFILKKKSDLEKLPAEGDMISISGVLQLFEEGKHSYCVIEDAQIEE